MKNLRSQIKVSLVGSDKNHPGKMKLLCGRFFSEKNLCHWVENRVEDGTLEQKQPTSKPCQQLQLEGTVAATTDEAIETERNSVTGD